MRLKHLDLVVAIAIALSNLLWSTLSHHHPQIVGILLALPQVFLLPGYTLIELLFHRRPMENVRRFVLSLSVSIAFVILSGFILQKSGGITMLSWAIYLSSMTVLFSLTAMFLRTGYRITIIGRTTLTPLLTTLHKHPVFIILMLVAVGLAILSVAYSSNSVVHERRPGFSQLWILPANATTKSCTVLIGVDSFEFATTHYRVYMTTSGALTTSWAAPVILMPQKTWQVVHQIDVRTAGDVRVEVQLYKSTKPTSLYRDVHLTMHSTKSKSDQQWHCTT